MNKLFTALSLVSLFAAGPVFAKTTHAKSTIAQSDKAPESPEAKPTKATKSKKSTKKTSKKSAEKKEAPEAAPAQ